MELAIIMCCGMVQGCTAVGYLMTTGCGCTYLDAQEVLALLAGDISQDIAPVRFIAFALSTELQVCCSGLWLQFSL